MERVVCVVYTYVVGDVHVKRGVGEREQPVGCRAASELCMGELGGERGLVMHRSLSGLSLARSASVSWSNAGVAEVTNVDNWGDTIHLDGCRSRNTVLSLPTRRDGVVEWAFAPPPWYGRSTRLLTTARLVSIRTVVCNTLFSKRFPLAAAEKHVSPAQPQ